MLLLNLNIGHLLILLFSNSSQPVAFGQSRGYHENIKGMPGGLVYCTAFIFSNFLTQFQGVLGEGGDFNAMND